jgi:hypothetical protein
MVQDKLYDIKKYKYWYTKFNLKLLLSELVKVMLSRIDQYHLF